MKPHCSLTTSPEFIQPRKQDSGTAQSEQKEKETHDTIGLPVGKAILQEDSISRCASMAFSARTSTWDSGYGGSNESLARPTATIGTTTTPKGSGLRSVYTAGMQETVDSDRCATGQPQQSNRQRGPSSTIRFPQHRILPCLKWLEQNVTWPFPQDHDLRSLARLSQLTIQEVESWFSWSRERLRQHVTDNLNELSVVQESDCEQDGLSQCTSAPNRLQTRFSNTGKAQLTIRPKLARPWKSEWFCYPRQKLRQIRKPNAGLSPAYTTLPMRRTTHNIAAILDSTAALTLGLSVPRENIELHSKSFSAQCESGLPTGNAKTLHDMAGSDSSASHDAPIISVRHNSTAVPRDGIAAVVSEDRSESIDHWLAQLVACNSEDVQANLRRWPVVPDADQYQNNIVEQPAIELLSSNCPVEPDEATQTDFHSLRVGEQSPSYLVGAGNNASQDDDARNADSNVPPSPLSPSEHSHEVAQLDCAISDTASYLSDIEDSVPQMNLWTKELEVFVAWARDNSIPFLIQDFNSHSRYSSSSYSSPSVRTCATGETSQANSHDAAENPTLLSPGNHAGANKRKRRKSDDGDRSPRGPNIGARASSAFSGDGSRRKFLACQYHKHDRHTYSRGRYKSCPNGFDGINRLKGHLGRVHSPQYYCYRCKRIFREQNDKNLHEASPDRCEIRELPEFDDMIINDEKKKALRKKQAGAGTEEQEWYRMWHHLFAEDHPPESPYQDTFPETRAFRERAEFHRPLIIQRFRHEHPTWWQIPDDILNEFYRISIEQFIDDVEPQIRSTAGGTSETPAHDAGDGDHLERLSLAPESFSGPPWSASVPQTIGTLPQQALNDFELDFTGSGTMPTVGPQPPSIADESFQYVLNGHTMDSNILHDLNRSMVIIPMWDTTTTAPNPSTAGMWNGNGSGNITGNGNGNESGRRRWPYGNTPPT